MLHCQFERGIIILLRVLAPVRYWELFPVPWELWVSEALLAIQSRNVNRTYCGEKACCENTLYLGLSQYLPKFQIKCIIPFLPGLMARSEVAFVKAYALQVVQSLLSSIPHLFPLSVSVCMVSAHSNSANDQMALQEVPQLSIDEYKDLHSLLYHFATQLRKWDLFWNPLPAVFHDIFTTVARRISSRY